MPRQLTQAVVEEWITLIKGKFNVRDIWNEIGIESPEGKAHLRVILQRLEEKGIVESNGGGGIYRKIDTTASVIEWQTADPNKIVGLQFPFGEHEVCKIFPKSIVIVAGSKNAGKTAYLYNFIKLNMFNYPVDLYNSETSPEQMKERFDPLGIPEPAPFVVFERYDNFADVIHPDHISVIDYLSLYSEYYLAAAEIDRIFRKLKTGVAVIAMQRPPATKAIVRGVEKKIERDLAYGGAPTSWRAALYVTMGDNKLKLAYVKTPANPKLAHPNNMTWSFRVAEDGVHFADIQRDYGD